MKNCKYIGLLLLPFIASCAGSEDMHPYLETPGDHMKLTANGDTFIMSAGDEDIDVLTFSWNEAINHGETATTTYFYRIAPADDIKNADLVQVDDFHVTYTGDDLNEMLKGWGMSLGTAVEITAEVIGIVDDPTKYYKPETSFCTVVVAGFEVPSKPYFIENDAVDPGWNIWYAATPDNETVEVIPTKVYKWTGWFESDKPVKFNSAEDGSGTYLSVNGSDSFTAPRDGYYTLTVSKKDKSVKFDPVLLSSQVYLVGTPFACMWDVKNAMEMTQSDTDPTKFTYTCSVTAGQEMKGLNRKGSWTADGFMPYADGTDPCNDDRVEYVKRSTPEKRWKFTRSGRCTIEIDVNLMKINITWLN